MCSNSKLKIFKKWRALEGWRGRTCSQPRPNEISLIKLGASRWIIWNLFPLMECPSHLAECTIKIRKYFRIHPWLPNILLTYSIRRQGRIWRADCPAHFRPMKGMYVLSKIGPPIGRVFALIPSILGRKRREWGLPAPIGSLGSFAQSGPVFFFFVFFPAKIPPNVCFPLHSPRLAPKLSRIHSLPNRPTFALSDFGPTKCHSLGGNSSIFLNLKWEWMPGKGIRRLADSEGKRPLGRGKVFPGLSFVGRRKSFKKMRTNYFYKRNNPLNKCDPNNYLILKRIISPNICLFPDHCLCQQGTRLHQSFGPPFGH